MRNKKWVALALGGATLFQMGGCAVAFALAFLNLLGSIVLMLLFGRGF